jgi:MFS family permease
MLVLREDVSWLVSIPTFAVAGLGMGLAYSPLALIVLREAAPENQGASTSALSLTDSLGQALGTGISGAIIAASLRATDEPVTGLAVAFTVTIAVGLGGLVLTRRLRPLRLPASSAPAMAPISPSS